MIKFKNIWCAHRFWKKGEPGTIVETTKKAIIVATASEECIALTDIQLAGKNVCK